MQFPTTINGQFVTLEQFTDDHIPQLQAIAFDAAIWQNLPYNITDTTAFNTFIDQLKNKHSRHLQFTYVIRNNRDNRICGSTGFINMDAINRKLEIGPTWLTPTVWGTNINIDSKYLLLTECFEQRNIVRVALRTRETNIRSQKAIEKIGGVKEGILRYHRINEDGSFRNTIVYSIIQPDWSLTKTRLKSMLDN